MQAIKKYRLMVYEQQQATGTNEMLQYLNQNSQNSNCCGYWFTNTVVA